MGEVVLRLLGSLRFLRLWGLLGLKKIIMQVQIKATKIELTPEIKDYVQEKMDMLDKYLGNFQVINADFEVEKISEHHAKGKIFRAEFNLSLPGEMLRVEKSTNDIFKAIDKVKDHMEIIIKKYKEKKKGR